MLITQDTKIRTRNLELGGGLESGDGGDDVIGIEELEEQVSAKGGRTHCGRPHEARSLLWKIVKKSRQVNVIFPEQIWCHKFPNLGSTPHEHRPLSIFCLVFISLVRNSLLSVRRFRSFFLGGAGRVQPVPGTPRHACKKCRVHIRRSDCVQVWQISRIYRPPSIIHWN